MVASPSAMPFWGGDRQVHLVRVRVGVRASVRVRVRARVRFTWADHRQRCATTRPLRGAARSVDRL